MIKHHPDDFHYHELALFGNGGLRFREANNVIDDMLKVCQVVDGGISYDQIREYVACNWKQLTTPGSTMPAYIQLDHVYGLEGIDLNLTSALPLQVSLSAVSESSSSSSSSVVPAVVTPPLASNDHETTTNSSILTNRPWVCVN